MVLQEPIVMNLDKYGAEGYISLAYPPVSKLKRMQKAAGAQMVSFKKNGEPQFDTSRSLEAEFMLNIFPYIEDAPFKLDVDSFFEFTDKLDAIRRGMGEEFYNDLVSDIERVKTGETSPSPDSQEAKTASLV